MSALDLGPGWAKLEFGIDDSEKVVRIGQDDRDLYVPKAKLADLIAQLEALKKVG